jgi:16S rRNA (guanine966-N2)-methyltransferase
MRIIGGSHGSRRINAPKSLPLRPTTDFAKESLFNVLENKMSLEDISVLDLFSGTGAISLEFASRGAKEVASIDNNFACIRFLKDKSAEFGLNCIKTHKNDALKHLKAETRKFDIIFADPPYEYPHYEELIKIILEKNLLKPSGLLIVEHSSRNDFSGKEWFLELRKCGDVNFSFFKPE